MKKIIFYLLILSFSGLSADLAFSKTNLTEAFEKSDQFEKGSVLQPRVVSDRGDVAGFIRHGDKRMLFVMNMDGKFSFPKFENNSQFQDFAGPPQMYGDGQVVGVYLHKNEQEVVSKRIYQIVDNMIVDIDVPSIEDWPDLFIIGVNNDGIMVLADRKMPARQTHVLYGELKEGQFSPKKFQNKALYKVIAVTDTTIFGIYHPTFSEKKKMKEEGVKNVHRVFRSYFYKDGSTEDLKNTQNVARIVGVNNGGAFLAIMQNNRAKQGVFWIPDADKVNIGNVPNFDFRYINDLDWVVFKNAKNIWAMWRKMGEHKRGPLRGFIVNNEGKRMGGQIDVQNVLSLSNEGHMLIRAKIKKENKPAFYLLKRDES